MTKTCVCGALLFAFLVGGRSAQAEGEPGMLGVTLESCGDVKAEEVQEALELEYQGGLLGTMVTVVCGESSATLSVVGPSNPKGRIVSIDLTGVSAIAMPRTIALLASELWTAPEADPAIHVALSHNVSGDNPGATSSLSDHLEETPLSAHTLRESYRSGATFGFSLGLETRAIDRERSSFPGSDDFLSWTLSAEWAVRPSFGVYLAFSHANSIPKSNSYPGSEGIAIYDRGEIGSYVPVVSGKWRIDMRFGAGYDKQFQPNTFKLDYEYLEVGADFLYFMRDNFMATGRWSYDAILDGTQNTGFTAQLGAIWRLRPFLLEGKWTLSQADIKFRGESFDKVSSRGELGLRYSF